MNGLGAQARAVQRPREALIVGPGITVAVWVVYLLAPVQGWGVLAGRPLGLVQAAVLAAAAWLAATRGPLGFARTVGIALVAKTAIGALLIVPHGFAARYHANANFQPPIEHAFEPSDAGFTRTDRRLRFGFANEADVPLGFFNTTHFNYYRDTDPDRKTLPFSVIWSGFWRVTSPGRQLLYVHAPAGTTELTVGQQFSVRLNATDGWNGSVTLPTGLHRVLIAWSVPPGGARVFEAGHIVDGREEPFDDSVIVRRQVSRAAIVVDATIRWLSRAFDVMLIALVFVQVARHLRNSYGRLRYESSAAGAVALVWMLGMLDALAFATPTLGRAVILSGGDDWLTYESQARDLAAHGILLTGGAPLGQGTPFYGQPLYPYFLWLCHWMFGDGLWGVYFVQRFFAAATVVLLWRTAARMADERFAAATLVTAIIIVYEKYAAWSGILLTEVLFVPLVCLWVYLLVRAVLEPSSRWWTVAAGLVGGLATLTRSSLLLGWVMVVPVLALTIRGWRGRAATLMLLVSTAVAVTSLVTIRNWVVARTFTLITSEGSVVLYQGNAPPTLSIPPAHQMQYERLGLDRYAQSVVEYARQQPGAFMNRLWQKLRYTLGWFDALLPGAGTSMLYIAVWTLALVGVGLLPWMTPARARLLLTIPLVVAASHFAIVVIFQPHVYGDRLIMPLYMLLVPLAAIPLFGACTVVMRIGRERLASLLWLLLFVVATIQWFGGLRPIDLDVFAIAVLAGGLAVAGVPELSATRVMLYTAYAVVLAIWLIGARRLDPLSTCRREWLFLLVGLCSAALVLRPVAGHAGRPVSIGAHAGAFAAGAAVAFVMLRFAGVLVMPERALLEGRLAAFGVAGAAVYALVWVEGWWPIGGDRVTRLEQGAVCALFAASLYGAEFSGLSAPILIIAGLLIGAVHADRSSQYLHHARRIASGPDIDL